MTTVPYRRPFFVAQVANRLTDRIVEMVADLSCQMGDALLHAAFEGLQADATHGRAARVLRRNPTASAVGGYQSRLPVQSSRVPGSTFRVTTTLIVLISGQLRARYSVKGV